jgi:hypothetical protein
MDFAGNPFANLTSSLGTYDPSWCNPELRALGVVWDFGHRPAPIHVSLSHIVANTEANQRLNRPSKIELALHLKVSGCRSHHASKDAYISKIYRMLSETLMEQSFQHCLREPLRDFHPLVSQALRISKMHRMSEISRLPNFYRSRNPFLSTGQFFPRVCI